MVRAAHLLAILLIPAASGFHALLAHRNDHGAEAVRLLKANETALPSGSDLVFSWARCIFCDGYDALLYLNHASEKRQIPYRLKSAVTSLKITNVPPRTVYRFLVRRLPADASRSEVAGRTFAQEAPSAVEDLSARAVTSSDIQVEWKSNSADGFVVRIFEEKTLVHERVVADFLNHSTLSIVSLEPDTAYEVRVTAFYFPPTDKSTSPVACVRVVTLPTQLPTLQVTVGGSSQVEISWRNPERPSPTRHELSCFINGKAVFSAQLSGLTDFVAPRQPSPATAEACTLETWFSFDELSKVSSHFRLSAASKESHHAAVAICDDHENTAWANYTLQRTSDAELLTVVFHRQDNSDQVKSFQSSHQQMQYFLGKYGSEQQKFELIHVSVHLTNKILLIDFTDAWGSLSIVDD